MVQKELFTNIETNNPSTIIVGLDEAGRGPLAGPVYAAAVILPNNFPFEILNDSKKLSMKKRKEIELIIKNEALAYSIAFATAKEIDELNILWASMLAMRRAYLKISKIYPKNIDLALIDGNRVPDIPINSKAIVKGDSKIHEIMAASILAKNKRDEIMNLCDKKWPIYGFKKHMGYPTKVHREMLEKYGTCPIHRKSFSFKKVIDGQKELF